MFYSSVLKYTERSVELTMNIIFSFKVIFSVICLTRLINYSEKVDPSCFDTMRYMYSTALPYLCFVSHSSVRTEKQDKLELS